MTAPFAQTLAPRLSALPAQLQKAARWVADNPQDVALLSMREQARRAGVQPATMTRLAQALGFEGYEGLREGHRAALRQAPGLAPGLADHAARRVRGRAGSDTEAAQEMLHACGAQVAGLAAGAVPQAVVQAAALMAQARQVYCLGMRSSHVVAWHVSYALSLISDRARLLDGIGGTGLDALARAQAGDVLFVCGVAPYTRAVIEVVAQARGRGLVVVALTDSALSPLICAEGVALIVPTASASFLHSMAPALALAEVLVALVARGDDPAVLDRLHGLDRQLAAFNTYHPDPI
ncbi:MAG: MurR/RpiR family transcriptional regulator [Natronohydrobacter sp.]|nr:MurR/RpiR family transcriptional regulator [Natronohydrobacter sp.]